MKIEGKLSLLNQAAIPKSLKSNLNKEIGSPFGVLNKLSNSLELFEDGTYGLRKEFEQIQEKAEKN